MDCHKINEKVLELAKAKALLIERQNARSLLNFSGHQENLTVNIKGMRVEVTEFDRNYQSKVKRGYEMIHLGCIKIAEAELDKAKSLVSHLELELKELVCL